jgi:hypothetical protein
MYFYLFLLLKIPVIYITYIFELARTKHEIKVSAIRKF